MTFEPKKKARKHSEFKKVNFIYGANGSGKQLFQILSTKLKELKEKDIQQKSVLDKQIETKNKLEEDFKEEFWDSIYKKHEIQFKEAFKGVMQKKPFMSRVIEEFDNNESELKTIQELKERAETIFGETPSKLDKISTLSYSKHSTGFFIGQDPDFLVQRKFSIR